MYSPLSLEQILDSDGKPIRSARLFVYETGTTTPKDVFRTKALNPAQMLPWPIPVDANGRLPAIFVGQGDYDVIGTDGTSVSPPGAVLFSAQGLPGDPPPTSSPVFDPNRQIQTGAYVFMAGSGGVNGCVPCNGGTIGNAVSGASTRADADCAALFAYLWQTRADLAVTPQRGLTAELDFAAGVQIALPNFSSKLVAFAADGSPNGNLFAGGKIDNDPGTLIGLSGGEPTHTLSADEMPTHAHVAHFSGHAVENHAHTATSGIDTPGHKHVNGVIRKLVNSAGGSSATLPVSFYAFPDGEGVGADNSTSFPDANHNHAITVDPAGAFTPEGDVTIDQTGSSATHNNLPPFEVAGSVYLKL